MVHNVNNINNKVELTSSKLGKKPVNSAAKPKESVFNKTSGSKQSNIVTGKLKKATGGFEERPFVKLKSLENGRSLVADQNGKQWVMSHDGIILKASYVAGKQTTKNQGKAAPDKKGLETANFLAREFNSAQKSFNAQMKKDGWAGDLADGISRAWTWATDSKNSANYVRDDLKAQKKNVKDLQNAAKQGQAQFNAKFKEIYGVNYNQQAMDKYMAEPTEENYKKAFGTKTKNIKTRVDKYNQSQDTGAVAVKTTTKVAAGVAIGVATGGTGLVALGAAAAATAATSVIVEETDALKVTDAVTKGKFEFREGTDHKKIFKDAAWDGASVLAGGAVGKVAGTVIKGTGKMAVAGRAAMNVTGDVAVGAAQEYTETGKITAAGVATNAVMSGVGGAVTSGALNKGVKAVKKRLTGASTHTNITVDAPQSRPVQKATVETPQSGPVQKAAVEAPQPKPVQKAAVDTPQTETAKTASSESASTNSVDTSIPPNVKQSILSSVEGADHTLRHADLSKDEVQDQLLSMMEKEIPCTRRVPGRVKTLKELQSLVNSSSYSKMNDAQKHMAKLAIIRSNPRIDSRALFDDLEVPMDLKRRLADIENCISSNSPSSKMAAALYKEGDFDTLITVAKAKGLDESVIKQMEAAFDKAQANGTLLIQQTSMETRNIPVRTVNKDGKNYQLKVIDCTDSATFANPELYGLEAGTTPENMRLTVHMNNGFNRDPRGTIGRMRLTEDLNLSASITDGKNTLYDNQQIGIVLDYDMGSVSYASNYAAGTGFCKTSSNFADSKLTLNESSKGTFIRERFIKHINENGANITTEDYAAFSRQFQTKGLTRQDLRAISQNGMVDINGKSVPLSNVEKALFDSTDDLMRVSYEMRGIEVTNGFNEVNVFRPNIKALYVRANSADATLESLLSAELLDYAQRRNLPIVFQRHVIK